MTTKYMIVSGFLGSGKTTTMIAMARNINKRLQEAGQPGHSAIIANDLGAKNLVDADYTRTADVAINEITGDCICYVTEDLVSHIDRLANDGANIVISDIPGCGVGALNHVYVTLTEDYPGKYDLLPLVCLVDPIRLRMVLPEKADIHLPEEMRFVLNAQLAEADVIVLNKCDLIDEEERESDLAFIRAAYPDTPVMAMSARTGEGVDEVVDYVLAHQAPAEWRDLGTDSEEFDSAEAQMCWYNRRFFAEERNGKNIDFNEVIEDFMEAIREGLIEARRNVPHLKLFAAGEGDDFVKCSIVGIDYDLEFERKLDHEYSGIAIVVNARAVCESETFGDIAEDAMDAIKSKYNLKCRVIFTECFGFADEGRRNDGRASRYAD
ncbi:MAG: GTPase (G3E family) [Eggerthellaceae bacterium]|nr:GTPase (G3E family) [Eggerthellaceae bacterium]